MLATHRWAAREALKRFSPQAAGGDRGPQATTNVERDTDLLDTDDLELAFRNTCVHVCVLSHKTRCEV